MAAEDKMALNCESADTIRAKKHSKELGRLTAIADPM